LQKGPILTSCLNIARFAEAAPSSRNTWAPRERWLNAVIIIITILEGESHANRTVTAAINEQYDC